MTETAIATTEPTSPEAVQTQAADSQAKVEAAEAAPKMFEESYVKELRDEAASWRTKTRELEAKLKDAKTMDEVNQIVSEQSKLLHAKDVEIVAIKHNIPEALRSRLQGETIEELEKDAAAIAALFAPKEEAPVPTPRPRGGQPSGGLDPTSTDIPIDDPAALAARISRRKFKI